MKLNERAKPAQASFQAKGLWAPDVPLSNDGIDSMLRRLPADVEDRYAAVDDIGSGVIVLRISRWPKVDRWGRLVFSRNARFPVSVHAVLSAFQARVDEMRTGHSQAAPDRELRVGDVFLLRGMTANDPL
jgi:hypothetical protein